MAGEEPEGDGSEGPEEKCPYKGSVEGAWTEEASGAYDTP